MNDTLLTVDSKGKVRVVEIECNWNSQFQCYIISRTTGLYDGKKTLQPNIEITKGKAKRTITEQATLQYDALVKEYLDKGYINSKDIPGYGKPDFDIHSCGLVKTDQNGAKKVMLCKVIDFNDRKLLKIKWLVSRKHDGESI